MTHVTENNERNSHMKGVLEKEQQPVQRNHLTLHFMFFKLKSVSNVTQILNKTGGNH